MSWLVGWSYRKSITISGSVSDLTDYQVEISVTYDADMQPDFDDIRFVDTNETVLSYYVESYVASTSAVVWVKIPSIPSAGTYIYMYYGNLSASSESNESAVFIGIHTASSEFSSTQGQDNWYYQEWTGAIYQNMAWDSGNSRWKGSYTYCLLWAGRGHPQTYDPALKWLSDGSYSLKITGNSRDADAACGDGVKVYIFNSAGQLWNATIANGDTTGYDFDISTNVSNGDAIYFRINQNGTYQCDGTVFDPTIRIGKYAFPEPSVTGTGVEETEPPPPPPPLGIQNIWTTASYVFKPTISGVNIYDLATEHVIAEAVVSFLGVSSVWSNDTHLFMGTALSGILWMPLVSISGSYDLTNQLSIYKVFPDITDNRVTYLHGSGNYLCAVTEDGVDHIDLTTNSGIYTTISGINKCHQTAEGTFYYTASNLYVMYDNTINWSSPDYTYPSGGIIPTGVTINDISIAEGTPNTILLATSSGVVVIEENKNDEENSRYKYFFRGA